MDKTKQPREKMRSIKTKLTLTIIPIVTLLLLILVIVSYTLSARIMQRNATDLLESSVKSQATRIESWLNENLSAFQSAKRSIEATNPQADQLQQVLRGIINSTLTFQMVYLLLIRMATFIRLAKQT